MSCFAGCLGPLQLFFFKSSGALLNVTWQLHVNYIINMCYVGLIWPLLVAFTIP